MILLPVYFYVSTLCLSALGKKLPMHWPLLPEWRVAGKAGINAWCLRGLGCCRGGPWVCVVGVEGVCAQRMSLTCCSHFLVVRAAQFVFVAVGGVVREIGDAWGLAWVGRGGGLGIQRGAWGGRGDGCVGSFIGLLFLLTCRWDCAARVGLVDWGRGEGGGCPKAVGVLAVAALWEGRHWGL